MSIGESDFDEFRTRYRILKTLFDYNNDHPFVSLEKSELLTELGLPEKDLENNIRFLQDKMLVETVWFMGGEFWTKISSEGIEEFYKAEKDPEKGTMHFPPVNLFYGE
jgi:hypothetical protein